MRTDLPQTQKAAQTSSFCRTSNSRDVISGCGPSSKLSRISPRRIPTSWIRCQIVHCARNLCANCIHSPFYARRRSSQAFEAFGVGESSRSFQLRGGCDVAHLEGAPNVLSALPSLDPLIPLRLI